MDDILREFLVECGEHLDRMEQGLLVLENEPGNQGALQRVFRAMHTIKGTCGFFALDRLEEVAHAAETLLARAQDGEAALTGAGIEALLRVVDVCRKLLEDIERTGGDDGVDTAAALAAVAAAADGAEAPAAAPAAAEERAAPEPGATFVRVDVGLLDSLMNLVGELVLVRNRIDELADGGALPTQQASQQLSRITAALQETVMKGRMEPIGKLFGRLPRVARDLARDFGKRVRVELKGQGTELDRSVIEAITDPITHLLRNALDHGIERPPVRQAAGKPEEGVLALEAFQESGQVVVEIRDDGRGIDADALRAKAVATGLLTAERAAECGAREALQLVFAPGLSTAAEVTSVSGRGVGMDVVKSNVEELGGSVDLDSEPGRGTRIRIRLPLTLAIIPGLLVEAADRRFVIPQGYLCELVRLPDDDAVETVHDAPVFRLRDQLLPLVHLGEQLGLGGGGAPGETHIAVLEVDGHGFGLVVDRVVDTREVVVKPLGQPFKAVPLFSGACIQGDGTIALILDVARLGARAGFRRDRAGPWTVAPAAAEAPARGATERLLLVETGGNRAVLKLDDVARLEEFASADVETAGEQRLVRYHGGILPLVPLTALLPQDGAAAPATAPDARVSVVVLPGARTPVGLVVDRIVDVVETVPELRDAGRRTGVLGTVVVREGIAEYCDTPELVRQAEARCAGVAGGVA